MDFFSRSKAAHKGDFGKVAVIGGSKFCHGAPLLAGLGVLAGGADLCTLFLPPEHAVVARERNLNFFVREFSGSIFSEKDAENIADFCTQWADVVVIGNGFFGEEIAAVQQFFHCFSGKVVADGGALFPEILPILSPRKNVILTPHEGEFHRLFGVLGSHENLRKIAAQFPFVILKKGEMDSVVAGDHFFTNAHGAPEMAVGGTGDALAGVCAAFFSRTDDGFEAAKSSAEVFALAGERAAQKYRVCSAEDILEEIRIRL